METDVKPKSRRRHSAEFKAEVVAACLEPGVSVSGVARRYDLNDNLVHQWRRGRGVGHARSDAAPSASPLEFIAMSLPTPTPAPVSANPAGSASDAASIRIEIRRGGAVVDVSWPASAAADCAAFLREWLLR